MGACLLLTATLLLLRPPAAAALMEPELCYVLDAILFLYGIVLTGLYCRLRFLVHRRSRQQAGKETEEAVYTGLSGESQEMYETLQYEQSPTPPHQHPSSLPPQSSAGP